jgi:hypothetical protein
VDAFSTEILLLSNFRTSRRWIRQASQLLVDRRLRLDFGGAATDFCLAGLPTILHDKGPPPANVDIDGLNNVVGNAPISHGTAFQKWGGPCNTGATAAVVWDNPGKRSRHLLKLSCSIRRVAEPSQDHRSVGRQCVGVLDAGPLHLPNSRAPWGPVGDRADAKNIAHTSLVVRVAI